MAPATAVLTTVVTAATTLPSSAAAGCGVLSAALVGAGVISGVVVVLGSRFAGVVVGAGGVEVLGPGVVAHSRIETAPAGELWPGGHGVHAVAPAFHWTNLTSWVPAGPSVMAARMPLVWLRECAPGWCCCKVGGMRSSRMSKRQRSAEGDDRGRTRWWRRRKNQKVNFDTARTTGACVSARACIDSCAPRTGSDTCARGCWGRYTKAPVGLPASHCSV
jgi:hypothetical protein